MVSVERFAYHLRAAITYALNSDTANTYRHMQHFRATHSTISAFLWTLLSLSLPFSLQPNQRKTNTEEKKYRTRNVKTKRTNDGKTAFQSNKRALICIYSFPQLIKTYEHTQFRTARLSWINDHVAVSIPYTRNMMLIYSTRVTQTHTHK